VLVFYRSRHSNDLLRCVIIVDRVGMKSPLRGGEALEQSPDARFWTIHGLFLFNV
jgi:hypothetical protein